MKFIDYKVFLLLLAIVFSIPENIHSQTDGFISKNRSLLDTIVHIYGKSELLVNGPLYFQSNRMAKGSPFLETEDFSIGTVYIAGNLYSYKKINYDISLQKLLLLIKTEKDERLVVELSDVMIDSFLIKNKLFINPSKYNLSSDFPYLHLINHGTYGMLLGYSKDFINRYNENTPNGKFSKKKVSIFILYNDKLISVGSKKAFLALFPENKKDISVFLRKNKINLWKSTQEQLKHLMDYCNKKHSS